MRFATTTGNKVKLITEKGIGRKLFIDDIEITSVTDVDVAYGVNELPKVKIEIYAREVIIENDGEQT